MKKNGEILSKRRENQWEGQWKAHAMEAMEKSKSKRKKESEMRAKGKEHAHKKQGLRPKQEEREEGRKVEMIIVKKEKSQHSKTIIQASPN